MDVSSRGISLIQNHEGFVEKPYRCPAGKLTVGYGHVISQSEKGKYDAGITKLQALTLLKNDILKACVSVARLIKVQLSQNQFDALVSFTFNLGGGRLQASALRQKLNRGDYPGAAAEFKKWVWAGGRRLAGLMARRADEAALFIENDRSAI